MKLTSLYWILQSEIRDKENSYETSEFECFPCYYSVTNYCKQSKKSQGLTALNFTGSETFWLNFAGGLEIFIVDRFFDEHCFKFLLQKIKVQDGPAPVDIDDASSRRKVCILTRNDFRRQIDVLIGRMPRLMKRICDIQVFAFNNGPYINFNVHDRFVLIDNSYWHFGSTVGGVYSEFQLTAFSGPWEDVSGSMRENLYLPLRQKKRSVVAYDR